MNLLFLLYGFLCCGDRLKLIINKTSPGWGFQKRWHNQMKRTLLLDEDDLIMVVKEDIVKQIDENRGEMNRTEFVNYLIQCQLKEMLNQKKCISKDEFQAYTRQMTDLLHNFLQFFVSYGMSMGKGQAENEVQLLNKQLESFLNLDDELGK
jgi:hypothetical protein